MSENRIAMPESLGALRRRLTAWYAGIFLLIILLLGFGMFAVATRRFDNELDESLRAATSELEPLARMRNGLDVFPYVRIPDRTLALMDTLGRPVTSTDVPGWASPLAAEAWRTQRLLTDSRRGEDGHILRVAARPLPQAVTGSGLVAIAVADAVELEDRYRSLILELVAAAGFAVLLVMAGGHAVARKSIAPVEQAFEHMRRFMADAAHELRTPISVVRGRAGVALQRPRSEEEYKAALNGIEREAERLGRIVDDLLMLARADAGERRLERVRLFMDDVMLDAADSARTIASRKNVSITVTDLEEAPVTGDAMLLRQLTLILLDNAIKYTEPNGAVSAGVHADGAMARLTIRDTGIGIPEDQLPHVFERFYRGDAARTRSGIGDTISEGAGLGLSIARWIVEEHGGIIDIESVVGRGTTVTVKLPLAEGAPRMAAT